ncbi:MAG: DUF2924 domain-containing protein [Bacteroidales bacterium]|nr:DUF2924 domain-containing protein [Bacteroidales bacterium]
MTRKLARELAALPQMTVRQLVDRYEVVFGEPTGGRNKDWLVKRIAWRLQAEAEGGLSERARERAAELARDADLRTTAPKSHPVPVSQNPEEPVVPVLKDPRLPPPGTVLTRTCKGTEIRVTVRANGIEYAGTIYPSLSAAAKAASGSHVNGFVFFKLTGGSR